MLVSNKEEDDLVASKADSHLRLINFAYQSTLGWRVIQKKREGRDTPRTCLAEPPSSENGTYRKVKARNWL